MWDFILYCLKCVGMTISTGFGGNPEGMTFKIGVIGILTIIIGFIIGVFLYIGILWVISLFIRKKDKKDNGDDIHL